MFYTHYTNDLYLTVNVNISAESDGDWRHDGFPVCIQHGILYGVCIVVSCAVCDKSKLFRNDNSDRPVGLRRPIKKIHSHHTLFSYIFNGLESVCDESSPDDLILSNIFKNYRCTPTKLHRTLTNSPKQSSGTILLIGENCMKFCSVVLG